MPNPNYDYLQQIPLIEIINVNWGKADVAIIEFGRKLPPSADPPTLAGHRPTIFRWTRPAASATGEDTGDYEENEFGFPPPEAYQWTGFCGSPMSAFNPSPPPFGTTNWDHRVDPFDPNFDDDYPVGVPSGQNSYILPTSTFNLENPGSPHNFWNRYVWAVGWRRGGGRPNNDTFLINLKKMRDDWMAGVIDPDGPKPPTVTRKQMTRARFWFGVNIEAAGEAGTGAGDIQFRFRSWRGVEGNFTQQDDGGADYVGTTEHPIARVFDFVANVPITFPVMQGIIIYNFRRTLTYDSFPATGNVGDG